MNDLDTELIDLLQEDFPVTRDPFQIIASKLGVSQEDVIDRTKKLKQMEKIRRIGAIFDSSKLGYCSTLCAMKVPDDQLEKTAQLINEYQSVTHNYIRSHEYNMWFTLTARSNQELNELCTEIQQKTGLRDFMNLPAIRMFKIKVNFPMKDASCRVEEQREKSGSKDVSRNCIVTSIQKKIIQEIQGDIPLCPDPFNKIAEKLEINPEELFDNIEKLQGKGVIKRFAAIVRHRNLGYQSNAMGVWVVPEEKVEESGLIMAEFSQVSHCYQRITRPGWKYNLFTMIHGKSTAECEETARRISEKIKINDYKMLYSTHELKKVSMHYFNEEG